MSSVAAFIRWDARCRNMPAHGATAGDTYHLGLRDYVEMYPCPNGLPIDHRQPADVPAWNDRVAKAKRDIDRHKREQAMELVEWTDSDRSELLSIARELDEYVIDQRASQGSIF